MAKEKLKSLVTSFTPDSEFLAILSPNGTINVWNTCSGSLLAEWMQSDNVPVSYSCMACSFIGKRRKKEHATLLLALGTSDGDILAIDDFTGDMKWESNGLHPGGVVGLAFANNGSSLHSIDTNGKTCEMNSESGELPMEFKASKKPISSSAFSDDEKILAVASSKAHIWSLEDGKKLLKLPDDLGPVHHIAISNNAKAVVTSGFGEKKLHVCWCNLSSKSVTHGPILSMRHPPLVIESNSSGKEKEDGVVVLAISESGVVYIWNLKSISQDEVCPTKITMSGNKKLAQQKGEYSKKSRPSILAAKLHDFGDEEHLAVVIAYGSIDSPQFSIVNVSNSGENIVVTPTDGAETVRENGNTPRKATVAFSQNRKAKKKRAASDMEPSDTGAVDTDNCEAMDGVLVEDDANEPTMGEKLASLNLQDNGKSKSHEKQESPPSAKPPNADSVNILLKQALHAEDHALLLDCLYTQDGKVIANSISQLNPSDVLKLLHSLFTIIDSRKQRSQIEFGSGIISHESSFVAFNSLYQLIESRISTFQSALQLSSCLDFLYAGVVEDMSEDNETVIPVIYEDKDASDEDEDDEQESEEAMETDQGEEEEEEEEEESFVGLSDLERGDDMSD